MTAYLGEFLGTMLLVLLGDGTCELVGTFADEFVDGKYPEGFRPKGFSVGSYVAVMTGENGNLYTKVFEEYAYEYFVNVPLELNNEPLKVTHLLKASPGGKTHDPVFFDAAEIRIHEEKERSAK